MKALLLVGIGGGVGAMARFGVTQLALRYLAHSIVPYGTLAVNLMGCFLIGYLAGWDVPRGDYSSSGKLLLVTGFLGGFTTFSAFGFESLALFRRDAVLIGGIYVLLSVVGGIGAVALGIRLAR